VYAPANEEWGDRYLLPTLGIDRAEVCSISDIRPGAVLSEEIELAIIQSQYVLVVLSNAWEIDEWAQNATSLSEHLRIRNRGIYTIPCILEDCSVTLSIETLQPIDCRDYAQKGLAKLRRLLELTAPTLTEETLECPYPGMAPLESKGFFFGRDAESKALETHVHENRLTLVVGPSGSGKSSLIRAGLMPRLRNTWSIREVRLLDRPCAHLCQALGAEVIEDAPLPDLGSVIHTLLAGRPTDKRVLIVVDPLDELLRAAPAEQNRFCTLLSALAAEPRSALVLALRADFYQDLMYSPCGRWSRTASSTSDL
jgi:TIR domain